MHVTALFLDSNGYIIHFLPKFKNGREIELIFLLGMKVHVASSSLTLDRNLKGSRVLFLSSSVQHHTETTCVCVCQHTGLYLTQYPAAPMVSLLMHDDQIQMNSEPSKYANFITMLNLHL